VVAVVIAFIALQATNSAAVSIMSLFVTQRLDLALIWSGIALGASALLEIPALLIIGRLSRQVSSHALVISGCVTGTMYYVAMAFVADPITLVLLQVLNAWFFGIVAGVGLTMFQKMIPRPGLPPDCSPTPAVSEPSCPDRSSRSDPPRPRATRASSPCAPC
jgi:SET family sugar efflux transporter-like MFS transporter